MAMHDLLYQESPTMPDEQPQDISGHPISVLRAQGSLKKWSYRAIIALSFAIIITTLFEIMLRTFAPQPLSILTIYERHPRLPLYALSPNSNAHVGTGETNWYVRTNNLGHRVPQQPGAPGIAKKSVLVLGGTNTFGYGVDYEQTYAGRIAAGQPELQIINAAVQGFGPVQYRMILEDLIGQGLRPDMILVGVCPGVDYFHALASKDLVPQNGMLPLGLDTWKHYLGNNLHIYRIMSNIYHRLATGSDPSDSSLELTQRKAEDWTHPPLTDAISQVKAEFQRIREISGEIGSKLLFVLVPTADTAREYRERLATGEDNPLTWTEQYTQAILEDLGVNYVDALAGIAAMPPGTTHHRFDRHVRSEAHAVIYHLVEDVVVRLLSDVQPST